MESKITLTSSDDIAFVTMVDEARANAIDKVFCDELLGALREVEGSSKYRAVILQAKGRIFSAGGDLRQISDGLQRSDAYLESLISALNATIVALRRLPIPVIASVQGAAAGAGFSLAMACDLVVASSAARFVVGYAKLGTSSDGGLSFHLARRLGAARALEILLTRDSLSAGEAGQLGLVQRIAEPASLQEASLAFARKVIDVPAAAVREMKSLVGMVAEDNLERHLEQEKHAFLRCASTQAFSQRVAQFVAGSDSPRNAST
ncbi:enoyl-CoA hydratase/isomerase family protein [Paraburkholderia haematera]|uniref:4-chlorobenzoyl coenzyme A dehalogenase-2 n=1 Tax=Paraburkholderia haematera TaxID=2793077 RepID=A0ABN7MYQ7_9BURK|nr:enoyl-CoA hydratase/isomerase family protein [Paraburkholderia haematera]CAE6836229.1 4-chlorobenzoyl coenzyme A dehalogenase-2 [Paraburkholderia haematera]